MSYSELDNVATTSAASTRLIRRDDLLLVVITRKSRSSYPVPASCNLACILFL